MKSNLLLTVLATTVLAVTPAFAKKKETQAKAETYKIDTKASMIEWTGSKATGSKHHGVVGVKEGQIEVQGSEIKGGQFTADMATLENRDLAGSPENKAKLEGHLKSEDFFNVTQYPESVFKIKSAKKTKDNEYTIKGELTMLGKTQPIEFPATVTQENGKMTGIADVKIDRTKWNLKYGSGKFFKNLGDKLISDEFNLKLVFVAVK